MALVEVHRTGRMRDTTVHGPRRVGTGDGGGASAAIPDVVASASAPAPREGALACVVTGLLPGCVDSQAAGVVGLLHRSRSGDVGRGAVVEP